MKILLAIIALILVTRADAQAAGQVVSLPGLDASKYCSDCKVFFSDIQQIISSPNTTKMLEQMFDNVVCSKLGAFSDMCKGFVDELMPQIFQYLAGLENPDELCTAIGMCAQSTVQNKLKLSLKPVKTGVECEFCKMGVVDLRNLMRDQSTQNDINDFLKENVCTLLGKFREQCKMAVDQYSTLLFQLLVNELDPTIICDDIHLCTGSQKSLTRVGLTRVGMTSKTTNVRVLKPSVSQPQGSEECTLCELVLQEIDQVIAENTTIEKVETALLKVCAQLPDALVLDCNTAVKVIIPEVLMLIKQMGPKAVCNELGLCAQTRQETVPTTLDSHKHRLQAGNETCILCEFVLKEVDLLIGDNKSQANVEKVLDEICTVLPSTISKECQELVNEYGPAIINLIVQELDPQEVCKTLRLCTGQTKQRAAPKKMPSSVSCVVCEFIMKEVDSLIGSKRTEETIREALDKVCSLLPDEIQDECKTFVQTYGEAVIQLLLQELDPRVICQDLGLCTTTSPLSALHTGRFLKVKDDSCALCKLAVGYILNVLKNNKTVAEVEELLDQICQRLPQGVDKQCEDFVAQYTPIILETIKGDISADSVCQALKLCPSSDNSNKLYFAHKKLGVNECSYGPKHWCYSKENAIKCNAMKFCANHVWK